jgi:hypothetical protein
VETKENGKVRRSRIDRPDDSFRRAHARSESLASFGTVQWKLPVGETQIVSESDFLNHEDTAMLTHLHAGPLLDLLRRRSSSAAPTANAVSCSAPRAAVAPRAT